MNGHAPTDVTAAEEERTPLPTTRISRRLSKSVELAESPARTDSSRCRAVVSIVILTFINLLNYMDRYTLPGVLKDVQSFYSIDNSQSGLVQSSFIISYMFCCIAFGYLGDRFNRKLIMAAGILLWTAITLGSSFVGRKYFEVFLVMRALVGVGEASYSTIAPTIIADLFKDNARTFAMSVFYFAIPAGSGLGYVVGSFVAKKLGGWQWALRITPGIGFLFMILMLFCVKNPPRGQSEGRTDIRVTSWAEDMKYILKHKSFLLSSAGYTCVAFVTGALGLWAALYYYKSALINNPNADASQISVIFGAITCLSGLVGVAAGSFSASRLRTVLAEADPVVCAVGMFIGCPSLFVGLTVSSNYAIVSWVCVFISVTCISFTKALVTDIQMYVIIPTRRSSAEAVQLLMCQALGGATSPFLVGVVSDAVTRLGYDDYHSLQYALYMTCFACAVGGGFFLFTALFIRKDRRTTDLIIAGELLCNGKKPKVDETSETVTLDERIIPANNNNNNNNSTQSDIL